MSVTAPTEEKKAMNPGDVPNVAGAVETVESHLHPTPSWDLTDHPMPTGREEVWRFTPIRRIRPLLQAAASDQTLTWQISLPEGATLSPITPDQARAKAVEAPVDRVAALAVTNASKVTHLDVPAEAELTEPVLLVATGTGGDVAEHLVITVGRHARATIVIRYTGTARFAEKVELEIGDGAAVNLISVQDWSDDALHGGQRSIRVGRDAQVRTINVSLGGDLVRLVEDAEFSGPGGSIEQFGLYFVDAGQHIEHRLFVDHNAPHTRSNVDYRGALQGQGAHSVWVGDVLIRKVAEEIETYESNRNLVLTEGCRADSVPNLEIETGEILGAGHSSTTGRFDDEHLFYLTSRGIDPQQAKRLVVHGFFNDIVRRIGVPELEQYLSEAIENELEATIGRQPTSEESA